MESFMNQFLKSLGERLPALLGAAGILILGWLAALVAAAAVRNIFQKSGLDRLIVREISGVESAPGIEPGKWFGLAAYYVILLFVLVAFFQSLGLTMVTGPINLILNQLSSFAPRLLAASALFITAWVLARLSKIVIRSLLKSAQADRWLKDSADISEARKFSVSEAVANASYWLIFILFFPAILDTLSLTGLLVPVQGMTQKALEYLPNLFAGALILMVGWFVARIVRHISVNLMSSVGINEIGNRAGLDVALGKYSLSELLGLFIYALLLIPIAIAALDALQIQSISAPASQMLSSLLQAVPAVVTASLVLLVAFLAGRFVASLVTDLLTKIGFNAILSILGIGEEAAEGKQSPSDVAGKIVLAGVLFFAAIEAANALGLYNVAALLVEFATFAGHVILGLIIFSLGLYLANLAASALQKQSTVEGKLLPFAARVSILVLAAAMGLQQMGLASEIITIAFGLTLGSVAVAVALAFGLGAREIAAGEVERWLKNIRGSRK